MSIETKIKIIHRIQKIVNDFKIKYSHDQDLSSDLNKLSVSLNNLEDYLSKLDQLQPNYTTNEVNHYMVAINLDLDILGGKLEKEDYIKLRKANRVLKSILKFHPTKYSVFEYIVIWFYELLYYI